MKELASANEKLRRHHFWQVLSSLTYIPPIYLAFSISLIISVAIIFFFSLQSLCWFAAFTYPAYATFKCIQSNDAQDSKDWLTYWIVYGVLHFGDRLFDLFLWWIPYYQQLKLAFLIWCFLPQFKGSHLIYENAVRPVLVMHKDRIDRSLKRVQRHVDRTSQDISQKSAKLVPSLVTSIASMATKTLVRLDEDRKKQQ